MRRLFFYLITILLPVALIALFYTGYTVLRTVDLYNAVKIKKRGWSGKVHEIDPQLGFSPIPNASGAHVFPIGPDIPMRYDRNGFRVPVEETAQVEGSRPLILTLGGSFTYGDATYAKDTYPYLVGLFLNGETRNAGVCSYGLSQMVILARKLVPIHKPDYLIVQYSPWLISRATSHFAPSNRFKLPSPFFYEKEGGFQIHPPVFLPEKGGLPFKQYKTTEPGVLDAISFYWNVGLPAFFDKDIKMVKYLIQSVIGIMPAPTQDRDALVKYAYKEISDLAQRYGAQIVIVILGNTSKSVDIDEKLLPPDALIVKAHDALLERLPAVNDRKFKEKYAHWKGSPPVLVDSHPNEKAHRIIAEAIVRKIDHSNLPGSKNPLGLSSVQ